jgi:S-adenosylmethionine hydrolase
LPQAIWHIDNFGNCKTTLTEPDIHNDSAQATRFGTLPMIHHLRDVPDGTAAITVGSSGLRDRRFLELVIQRGNFAERHGARLGDDVFTDQNYFHHATKN